MPGIEFPELSPELALVIACSRWPLEATDKLEIQDRAAAPIDWDRFLAWVRRNRVAPLVYANLCQTAPPVVPSAVTLSLQRDYSHNARKVLGQVAETARICRLLADASIRSLIIKGPVLSQLVFGDPLLRESKDIDLLIDQARVSEFERIITRAGYRRVVPTELAPAMFELYQRRRCQFAYYLETREIVLELHWRLTSNPLLMPVDTTNLWNRLVPTSIVGACLRVLPDEELFLYLCVHGSLHAWFRVKWLADIAALLRRLDPEVIERIGRRAKLLGVDRSFHQAIILAHEMMAAPVPRKILEDGTRTAGTKRLAMAACRALNWQEYAEEPFETQWFSMWINWHAFSLRRGLAYRWRELQNQMFSPEDWARIRLPKRLLFLYVPLRPLSWAMRNFRMLVGGKPRRAQ